MSHTPSLTIFLKDCTTIDTRYQFDMDDIQILLSEYIHRTFIVSLIYLR